MSYEHDMTEFNDFSVKADAAVAIDECGEIWILCGKQRYFYHNLGLRKSEHLISTPTCTNYMRKMGLKATKVRLGNQCMLVETLDESSGRRGIKVIKNPGRTDQYIADYQAWQDKFQAQIESNVDFS